MRSYRPCPLVTDIKGTGRYFWVPFFFFRFLSFVCAMFKLCTVEGFSFVSMSLIFCFQVTTFSMPLVVQLKRMANNLVSSFLEIRCNGCNGPQMVVSPAPRPPEWSTVSSTTPQSHDYHPPPHHPLDHPNNLVRVGTHQLSIACAACSEFFIDKYSKKTLIWSANHHQQKPPQQLIFPGRMWRSGCSPPAMVFGNSQIQQLGAQKDRSKWKGHFPNEGWTVSGSAIVGICRSLIWCFSFVCFT